MTCSEFNPLLYGVALGVMPFPARIGGTTAISIDSGSQNKPLNALGIYCAPRVYSLGLVDQLEVRTRQFMLKRNGSFKACIWISGHISAASRQLTPLSQGTSPRSTVSRVRIQVMKVAHLHLQSCAEEDTAQSPDYYSTTIYSPWLF